ncbi:MAG: hypothetical protein V5A87_03405 [Candidatus Bipolaricaulota bacterium]|nr:hypothetical protein [Candidatus Bipolaricaulota bacterium]MBS3791366.1 hypothetical protein [Candidatus Bipolaricaulota bacterium]
MNQKTLDTLLALIGVGSFIAGLLEVLFGLVGETYTWQILTFGGDFTVWRGLILVSAGTLFFFAINQANPIQKKAQAVLACSMIWIIGGIEILSTVLNSVTGGEGAWINTVSEFLSHYYGPFTPSVLLLPISIVLVILVRSNEANNG